MISDIINKGTNISKMILKLKHMREKKGYREIVRERAREREREIERDEWCTYT